MTDSMPCTTFVLALYMTEQLIQGNQDYILHSHAMQQCVLPMGFMEQAGCCAMWIHANDILNVLMACLQLVGALVVQAQAALVTASVSSMVLTRFYARIPFGDFEMELSRARNSHYISITLHADEATGLLAQVCLGISAELSSLP